MLPVLAVVDATASAALELAASLLELLLEPPWLVPVVVVAALDCGSSAPQPRPAKKPASNTPQAANAYLLSVERNVLPRFSTTKRSASSEAVHLLKRTLTAMAGIRARRPLAFLGRRWRSGVVAEPGALLNTRLSQHFTDND